MRELTLRAGLPAVGVAVVVTLAYVATLGLIPALACIGLLLLVILVAAVDLSRAGAAFFAAGMFFAPLESVRPIPDGLVTVSDVFLAAGIALLVPALAANKARPPGLAVAAWLTLTVMCVGSSLVSADPMLSLQGAFRLLSAVVVLPLVVSLWNPSQRIVTGMAWAYVAGAAFDVVVGTAQGPEANDRYQALTTHPNFYGLGCTLAVGLCLYLYGAMRREHRWIVVVAGLINLVGVLESGSRAALLVAGLILFAYPFLENSSKAAYVMAVGLVGAVAVAGTSSVDSAGVSAVKRLLGDSTSSTSDTARENVLTTGLSDFVSRPLTGHGFTEKSLAAHNVYVEIGVALGIVGVLAFCVLMWVLVRPLLLRGGPLTRLAYTPFAYALAAVVSNSIWERFIWAPLAFALLAERKASAEPGGEPGTVVEPVETTDASRRPVASTGPTIESGGSVVGSVEVTGPGRR